MFRVHYTAQDLSDAFEATNPSSLDVLTYTAEITRSTSGQPEIHLSSGAFSVDAENIFRERERSLHEFKSIIESLQLKISLTRKWSCTVMSG